MKSPSGPEFSIRPVRFGEGADLAAIRGINARAFRMAEPGSFEKALRERADVLARVAVEPAGRVIGHIIFTPASIAVPGGLVQGMGLGELAVLPELQRRGVGSRLTRSGLGELRRTGCPFCIVVGHASYYPRFGFVPGSRHGLRCQWEKIPDASFMVCVLDEAAMSAVSGTARFRDVD